MNQSNPSSRAIDDETNHTVQQNKKAGTKPWKLMAFILTVVLASAWFVYWWSYARYFIETDDAYVRADIVTVSSRMNGFIKSIQVQDNQHIKAGAILANLDSESLHADLQGIDASLSAANAQLKEQQTEISKQSIQKNAQEALITEAKAMRQSSAIQYAQNQRDYLRQLKLEKAQLSTTQDVEDAKTKVEQSEADLRVAQAKIDHQNQVLKLLEQDQNIQKLKVDQALTDIVQQQATLKKSALALSYSQITAPISGTIGQRQLRLGQNVSVGTPLMAIVPDQRYIIANFKETQIAKMAVGQKVEITVDALADTKFMGAVESFAPASGAQFALLPPDNATGNFTKIVQRIPVKIKITSRKAMAAFKPGMSVIVQVDTRHD